MNQTRDALDEIGTIIEQYIDNSPLANPWEEGNMIFRWAETVHKCRKSRGITTRKDGINHNERDLASKGKTPLDYEYKKNVDSEKSVPSWDVSPSDFDGFFDSARFDRYLEWDEQPEFKRRSTWLYPDNGCWYRAEIYVTLIVDFMTAKFPGKKFATPKKHFAFGDLAAKSSSIRGGIVRWGWHVAPLIRLNDGKLYVMDPALNGDAVHKEGWYKLMMSEPDAKITGFVTCDTETYKTENSCFNAKQVDPQSLGCEIQGFLATEWERQIHLGRDPKIVLGDDTQFYPQG